MSHSPLPPFQCNLCEQQKFLLARNCAQQPSSFLFPTLCVGEQKNKELFIKIFHVGMFDLNYMCSVLYGPVGVWPRTSTKLEEIVEYY